MGRRAAFLDRDGTIIFDGGYLADPAGVRLLPGALDALRRLRAAGFAIIVVSNQSGLARGLIRPEQHAAVHARFTEVLAEGGITVDAAYYCVHGPDDGCTCRKPRPGMLERAASEHAIDLARSLMIGDKPTDVGAGRAVGCVTALLGSSAPDSSDADVRGAEWSAVLRDLERYF
jgi:histidinol-phosphate phosphatase family protein